MMEGPMLLQRVPKILVEGNCLHFVQGIHGGDSYVNMKPERMYPLQVLRVVVIFERKVHRRSTDLDIPLLDSEL